MRREPELPATAGRARAPGMEEMNMQATASATPGLLGRLRWNELILPWLIRLAFLGVGVLVGLYMLAPRQVRASDTYIPPAYSALQNAVVSVDNGTGTAGALLVKLADTAATRNVGFNDVGAKAVDNELVLYQLTRESTARTTYAMGGARTPLQAAIANGEGEVVAVHDVPMGTERLAVPESHRWMLVAQRGTLDALGIVVGSTLLPDSIVKVNY